jgi:hypothetical protein
MVWPCEKNGKKEGIEKGISPKPNSLKPYLFSITKHLICLAIFNKLEQQTIF